MIRKRKNISLGGRGFVGVCEFFYFSGVFSSDQPEALDLCYMSCGLFSAVLSGFSATSGVLLPRVLRGYVRKCIFGDVSYRGGLCRPVFSVVDTLYIAPRIATRRRSRALLGRSATPFYLFLLCVFLFSVHFLAVLP